MKGKNYKTLVLSGNSTNAVVSLGALQYIYENFSLGDIQTYVAVSSGTVISVLLSIGYTPIEIISHICFEKVYKNIPPFNLLNTLLTGHSSISFLPIRECIEQMIKNQISCVPTLEELFIRTQKTVVFTVYNLTDHKREYISHITHPNLQVVDAINMSCNFPIIFEPFIFENKLYIDGGLSDNFPIEFALNKFESPTLGIYIKNPLPIYDNNKHKSLVVLDLLSIMFSVYTESALEDKVNRISSSCDIIKLTQKNNFFNFNSTREDLLCLFDTGHKKAKIELDSRN
jgi:NTE family protein